jgi:hypothetical protein
VLPGNFAHPIEFVIGQVDRVPGQVVLTVAP